MKDPLYTLLNSLGCYLRSNKQERISIDIERIDDTIYYSVDLNGEHTDDGEMSL